MNATICGRYMKLKQRTLTRLREHINGDSGGYTVEDDRSPFGKYRTGPVLVGLFNEFGADDEYGQGFPSRKDYTASALKELNDSPEIANLICTIFDPLEYADNHACQTAIDDFNRYFERDGYQLILRNGSVSITSADGASVSFDPPEHYQPASYEFIEENIEKCDQKLRDGDYSGAITNARSLCEDVLSEIERSLSVGNTKKYDGNLPKLFKRTLKLLNANPEDYVEQESVVQLLRGLVTICDGISGMSNPMGDRHGGKRVRPKKHHAALAINASNTLCNFVVSSYITQNE